jgi:hypothetical protein
MDNIPINIDTDIIKRAEKDFEFTTFDAIKELLHFTKIRDRYIREDFQRLKDLGMSKEYSINLLAEKHHLAYDTIDGIVYPRQK